jgi:hypothetical protein
MFLRGRVRTVITFSIIFTFSTLFTLSLSPQALAKKKEAKPKGTPVLWREPANIESRDLYLGPGGQQMRPDLRRISFIKEEKGGYSTKYRVRDGAGREWVVKVGKEAQPETAATRLLWAAGYQTEMTYLVPHVTIPGKGRFENVRFEARPKSMKRLDEWKWGENPFIGTREFQGLKVAMVLINNWDIKDSNNKVLLVRDDGRNELRYIVSDLGATFGKTGSLITRSRNNPGDFINADFVDELKGRFVDFHYSGKRKGVFRDITIEQARWLGRLLSRLSLKQIKDAFRAANYDQIEIDMLANAVRARISELITLPQR